MLFGLACFFLLFGGRPAQGQRQIKISADEPIHYDMAEGKAVARGRCLVHLDENSYLLCDELQYDNRVLTALGRAQMNRDHLLFVGDRLQYDMNQGDLETDAIRFGLAPVYAEASSVVSKMSEKGRLTVLDNGRVYFGEPSPYTLSISARRICIDERQRVRFEHAAFYMGNRRFLTLPVYRQMLYRPPFYARSRYGHRHDLGFFSEQHFLWNQSPDLRLGGGVDYYSQRGWLLGPHVEWKPAFGNLSIRGSHICDRGARGEDIFGEKIGRDRYFLQGRCQMGWNDWRLLAEVNDWSDSDVLRDFSLEYFLGNQFPANFIELSHVERNSLSSFFLGFQPNDFENIVERLPEISYQLMPQRLGSTFLWCRGFVDYSQLQKRFQHGEQEKMFVNRLDSYFGFDGHLRVGDWLTFVPLAGTRVTIYDRTVDAGSTLRLLGQVGFDLRFDILGAARRAGNSRLLHRMQPSIRYRYQPALLRGHDLYPIETEVFDTNLPLIDLADRCDVDSDLSGHLVRFGLENTFFAPTRRARPLAEMNFFSDMHIRRHPGERRFSDLYGTVNIWPRNFFSLEFFQRIDCKSLTMNELRFGFSLKDGNLWRLSISGEYLRHHADQYRFDLFYQLTTRNQIHCFWRYDAREHSIVEQRYQFFRRLNQTCLFDTRLAVRSRARRENRFQLALGLSFSY